MQELLLARLASWLRFLPQATSFAGRLAVWLAAATIFHGACPAQVSPEYDSKALFLLNFAQFVEWPGEAFAGEEGPFIIGVLGADPFRGTLEKVIREERVRTRPVLMHHYERVEEVKGCHILFISASEVGQLRDILKRLQGHPILTVSDANGFLALGGMIRFVTENEKVRLQINNDSARAARLIISAKLLRVAEVVTTAVPE